MSTPLQSSARASDQNHELTADCDPNDVLEIVSDEGCRKIFQYATVPVDVSELVEEFDFTLSTAYRKVETLKEAGLLVESRSASDGRSTRYVRPVEGVTVRVADETRVEYVV